MIQESGNLEIFETEPDIFRMEDFNTKELLISSIVCELRNNDIDKALGLWRKIIVLTKSEQSNQNKNQSQIDQGWIDCFRKIHERCKHLKALIELLDRIHGENKELFDKFVERKAFQLLKSLNNVSCDVDMSKYVKFEQIFRTNLSNSSGNSLNTNNSHNNQNVIKLRDPSEENRRFLSKNENNERVVQTLKQINKNEIRQDLEEYNVFVLAHVLGYFIEGADSLVYYLFTKKLLRIKDKQISESDDEEENKFNDSSDEMYNIKQSKDSNSSEKYGGQSLQRREIVEIMIDRISSIEFITSQVEKISKKTETDPQKLKKYRLLLHLLGEREQRLAENQLVYTKYNSTSYQVQQTTNRKHMSESLYLRMTRHIESSKEGDQLSDKTCIWRYFETLLSQESTNLLDCSECKCLATEFIQRKFAHIISIYESAYVEFRANFADIVNEKVEENITNFCMQAPLRKQLIQLLERIQLNMENVDNIIFDVIVTLVLEQNSNDSINIVLISIKDALLLTAEQNQILLQLSAVMRMSFLLQDSNIINQMKLALTQNITNINYFIEKYLREVISKINQTSTVSDIIKLKYLANYLKNTSLQQELVLNCAENLLPNVLIPLITKKYLSFEDIDIIDNSLNQTFIQTYNSFGTQVPEQQLKQIIASIEEHQNEIDQFLFFGFVLQYIGAAAFKKRNEIYKQLFDTLISIINKKSEYEEILKNSSLQEFKTEIEFNNYLEEQKQCYRLCAYKSIDDLIVYNIIDLSRQQKYYDAAKLNYKYQNHSGENGVADYLKKLKEDIIPMEKNTNLSEVTLNLLDQTKNEIKKIS